MSKLASWREVDTSSWKVESTETRGKRSKEWVSAPDSSLWLRKQPRVRARQRVPYEPAIEWLMLRLARSAGLEAPESHCSSWNAAAADASAPQPQSGIIVRSFVDKSFEEKSSGAQVLRGHDASYPTDSWSQTVTRVQCALKAEEKSTGASLLTPFAWMTAFDAWIGNCDRHQENWDLIVRRAASSRLAPVYDVAACVGVELDDAHPLLVVPTSSSLLRRYVEKCPSGFGDGARPIRLSAVVAQIRSWPEWSSNVRAWIACFAEAMDTLRVDLVEVPDEWLPPPRKQLIQTLLQVRLQWLEAHA